MASGVDGEVIYQIRGDDSKLDGDLNSANSKVESGAGKLKSTMKNLAVGLGAAELGKQVIQLGADFEQTFANASTMFGDVAVDSEGLKNKILDMSDATGVAASEFNEGLYQALSAGVPVTEDMAGATSFLESNAKLAKAGFTDLSSAIDVSTSILNAYHMDLDETDKVHKILMQTQNKGKTTIAELSSAMSNVTPTAAAMNVQFEQVGASLATMTAQGVPTAQATTQLNQLFAELGKDGTKANKALQDATEGTKYAGKSFQDLMADGVPLSDVLNLINDNAQSNGQSMLDMFSSIDAGKAALTMCGDNAQLFTDNLAAMSTETDVVGQAFDKVSDTSANKFNMLMNQLKNVGIELFASLSPLADALFPALGSILSAISPLLQSIGQLIGGVINAALTAIQPIIDVLITALTVLIEPIQALCDALLPPLSAMLESLQPLFDLLTPIINILAKTISEVLNSAIKGIMPIIDGLKKTLGGIIDFITGVFSGNWSKAWSGITKIFSGIWETMKAIFKAPINWIIDGLNMFIRGLNKIQIPDWVPGVGGKGINIKEIPRLKVGMDYVPSDYFPAYLDAGEAVLTADEAKVYRSIGGKGSLQQLVSDRSQQSINTDDIASAISTAVSSASGSNETPQITVYLDGTKISQAMYKPMQDEQNRHGNSSINIV